MRNIMRKMFEDIVGLVNRAKKFIKLCLHKFFIKYATLTSILCALASLVTIFISFDTVYTTTAYSQKLEIELQKAEVDSNAYRILWQNEKEQSYIYYDQLRQIQANQEAQEAFDNDQNN